ncbi:MAG: hypothetical protein MI745_15800, partial [Pseudomonadales bacterium]|nr:hypothetical protein [Pseudomonadales bacterium]
VRAIWHPVLASELLSSEEVAERPHFLLKQSEGITKFSKIAPTFGFTKETALVRLQVSAHEKAKLSDYVLYIDYPLLDEVSLYGFNNGILEERYVTGELSPFWTRPVKHRAFVFPISVNPGETKEFIFVSKSTDTLQLPIHIYTKNYFDEHLQIEQYMLGIFYGGIFMMSLFIALLYIILRDNSLFYMSCFLICFIGMASSLNGNMNQFFTFDSPTLAKDVRIFCLGVGMFSVLMFTCLFLKSKHYTPVLHKILTVMAYLCLLLPLSNIVVPFYYVIQITLIYCLFITVAILAAGIKTVRQGYDPATYYLLGWFFFFSGGVSNVGRAFSVIPINLWTEYGVQFGSLFSTLSLGLGIAAKFRLERSSRL